MEAPLLAASSQSPADTHRLELARARVLLAASADGVLVTSGRRVVTANAAFCRLLGLPPCPDGLADRALDGLFAELGGRFVDGPAVVQRLEELVDAEDGGPSDPWALTDGRFVEVDTLVVRIPDASESERLWLWRDVTERVRLQTDSAGHPDLSFLDELTGVLNRRGFLVEARRHLDVAVRAHRPMLLLFVDVDGLKDVNDRLGHAAGDQLLVEMSGVLKSTFRERDLVARLGGDEFAVLVTDASAVAPTTLLTRLERRAAALNARPDRTYSVAFSSGVARFDPRAPEPLDVLLADADGRMYREKRRRKGAAGAH